MSDLNQLVIWFQQTCLHNLQRKAVTTCAKMSSIFGSSTGITIHKDNSENVANPRRMKKDDMLGKPPANKRAALGTITNLSTKSQLPRAAKQVILTF